MIYTKSIIIIKNVTRFTFKTFKIVFLNRISLAIIYIRSRLSIRQIGEIVFILNQERTVGTYISFFFDQYTYIINITFITTISYGISVKFIIQ